MSATVLSREESAKTRWPSGTPRGFSIGIPRRAVYSGSDDHTASVRAGLGDSEPERIPYEVADAVPPRAPKRKLPFIMDDGITVADSTAVRTRS